MLQARLGRHLDGKRAHRAARGAAARGQDVARDSIMAKPEPEPGRSWRDARAAIDVPYPTQLEAIKEITPAAQLTSARRAAPLPL
jgi:hypothetical protein